MDSVFKDEVQTLVCNCVQGRGWPLPSSCLLFRVWPLSYNAQSISDHVKYFTQNELF